jgi:hypothetical protein
LPGQAGRNDTATGAQIEQAVSQSLSTPKLQGKAFVRLCGAKLTIDAWRKYMPIKRPIPVPGRFGRTNFKFFSSADVKTELIFRAVPNSEIARTIYDVRQDLDGFYAVFGGYVGFLQAKQTNPKEVMEEARRRGIQLDDDDWDAIAGLCLDRLDQLKQGLRQTQDPQGLLQFIQPPISQYESYLDLQRKWYQDWLIWDEGREAPMPLRQAVELIISGNFMSEISQQAGMAMGQGIVEAAGQAPSALGQQLLQGQQPDPQAQQESEMQAQASRRSYRPLRSNRSRTGSCRLNLYSRTTRRRRMRHSGSTSRASRPMRWQCERRNWHLRRRWRSRRGRVNEKPSLSPHRYEAETFTKMGQIRIHVLTEGLPSFLVHRVARDEFIAEMVTELYGTRVDGSGFEWEAEELSEKDCPAAQ